MIHYIVLFFLFIYQASALVDYQTQKEVLLLDSFGERVESVSDAKYVIKYFEHKNSTNSISKDKVIVLGHGLTSNSREFDYYINFFIKQGYLVYSFNWPGFGAGANNLKSHRSYVQNYQIEDYNFHNLAKVAYPAVLKQIHHQTGSPLSYIGHSMGGMLGFAGHNESMSYVKELITIGSPMEFYYLKRFKKVAPFLKKVITAYRHIGRPDTALPIGSPKHPIIKKITSGLLEKVSKTGYGKKMFKWSTNLSNYTESEFSKMATKAISNTHPDILLSFLNFITHGFPYSERGFPRQTRLLSIYGEYDWMAHKDPIIKNIERQIDIHQHDQAWLLGVEKTGHLDEVSSMSVKRMGPEINNFIQQESSFHDNQSHRHFQLSKITKLRLCRTLF